MRIQDALANSGLPPLEAELLMAKGIGITRTQVLSRGNDDLTEEQGSLFAELCARRKEHEPIAYISGEKEFFGRSFTVNASVLIPRPCTELLVEQALLMLKGDDVEHIRTIDTDIVAWCEIRGSLKDVRTIVDIGTGSGCIAVTLACELPGITCIATDISADALDVARENALRCGVQERIDFRLGDGLAPVGDLDMPFIVVSNPPYIPSGETLMEDVRRFEPYEALFSGEGGTDVIRRITEACGSHPLCRGYVLECRAEQATVSGNRK